MAKVMAKARDNRLRAVQASTSNCSSNSKTMVTILVTMGTVFQACLLDFHRLRQALAPLDFPTHWRYNSFPACLVAVLVSAVLVVLVLVLVHPIHPRLPPRHRPWRRHRHLLNSSSTP
jgi:hypothetical protein